MDLDIAERVKALVATETGVAPGRLRPETSLLGDLGVDGADGRDLIEAFAREFAVDLAGFDPSRHFGPEGGGNPFALIFGLVEALLPRRNRCSHEPGGLVPITIQDLVEAAERQRWLKMGQTSEREAP